MPGCVRVRYFVLGLASCALAAAAFAQSDDRDRSVGYSAIIDNIDLLIDRYADVLARKYDLTEEQDEYTKILLRERSYEFFDQHEDQLRDLVDRLFEVRTGGEMSPDELLRWGQRAQPIYEAAKQIIIDGNNDWREILTSEQKKTHDEDLKLMYQSFETTEDQLSRIISGEMTVEEFRSPQRSRRRSSRPTPADEAAVAPEPESDRAQPSPQSTARKLPPGEPRPEPAAGQSNTRATRSDQRRAAPRAADRRTTRTPGARGSGEARPGAARTTRTTRKADAAKSESQWEKYVREFIEKYQLNDEQSQKATAVLEDCQSQADRYLRGRKAQLEKIDAQMETLKGSKSKDKAKSIAALTEKRKKIMAPIDQIFEQQLKPRLERLPTRAQRQAAKLAARKPATKKPAAKRPPVKRAPPREQQKEDGEEKEPESPPDE